MAKEYNIESSHWVLLFLTFMYVFLNTFLGTSNVMYLSIIVTVGMFLYYTWQRIFTVLVTAAVVSALVAMIPILAPVAFLLMVVIFFLRIGYIIDNWRAVLAGFYMYGVAILFLWYTASLKEDPSPFSFMASVIVAGIVTAIFHAIMICLYRNGYTLKRAMPIMGVAPLLIILLLLPFVHAFDGGDVATDTVDTSVDTAGNGATDVVANNAVNTVDTVDAGGPHGNGGDVVVNPRVHHTHDYYRTEPDGTVQHVRGYYATNPDGTVENNFSYNGKSYPDNVHTVTDPKTPSDSMPETVTSNHHGHEFAGADAGPTETKKKQNQENIDTQEN